MKLSSMYIFLILSLSIFMVLGISTSEESVNARASSAPTNLGGNSTSTLSTQDQSVRNATTTPNSFVLERNWTGSIPTFPTVMEAFKSQLNTSMNDATTTALEEVGRNSIAISSTLQPVRGFLVYIVQVVDTANQMHLVAVDAGDGRILSNILLPTTDIARMRSGPIPGGPAGPVSPIPGSGNSMPPLYPGPGAGGPVQPMQPVQPVQPPPPVQ